MHVPFPTVSPVFHCFWLTRPVFFSLFCWLLRADEGKFIRLQACCFPFLSYGWFVVVWVSRLVFVLLVRACELLAVINSHCALCSLIFLFFQSNLIHCVLIFELLSLIHRPSHLTGIHHNRKSPTNPHLSRTNTTSPIHSTPFYPASLRIRLRTLVIDHTIPQLTPAFLSSINTHPLRSSLHPIPCPPLLYIVAI